ncbi:MAG: amidohydrolase family protein [Candidatus Bathyarchaeia archaeon]
MQIIDTHSHLGSCRVFDLDTTQEELLNTMKKHGIAASIVQPYPGAPEPRKVHDAIAKLAADNSGKIFGLVSLTPHQNEETYVAEVERLVKDHGFVGVKLHTIGHAVNPLGSSANKIFETANRLGVPVMIHTGPGIPFALPSLAIVRATQYPNLPIILAHAGWGIILGPEVHATVKTCKNIYLEPSWCSGWEKGMFISAVGADRMMFGSDLTINVGNEVNQFKTLDISDKDLEKCLYETPKRLFKLSV